MIEHKIFEIFLFLNPGDILQHRYIIRGEISLVRHNLNPQIFHTHMGITVKYISLGIKEEHFMEIFKANGYNPEQMSTQRFCFKFSAVEEFSLKLRQTEGQVRLGII